MEIPVQGPNQILEIQLSNESLKGSGISSVSSAEVSPVVHRQAANELLKTIGSSPLTTSRSKEGRIKLGKGKLEEVVDSVCKKLCKPLDLNLQDVLDEFEKKSRDLDLILAEAKLRLKSVTQAERYQLLGLCPLSMSIQEGATLFEVSYNQFAAARKFRIENGLLAKPVFKRTSVSEFMRKLITDIFGMKKF